MKKVAKILLGMVCVLSMMCVSNISAPSVAYATDAKNPNFGPNVITFDSTSTNVQTTMDNIFSKQYMNQFGNERYAILFKPGSYNVNTNLGYYTTVSGLGKNPDDVSITGGIGAINQTDGSGGLNNFWRSMENFTINPTNQGQKNFWGVSQASPMRRLHIKGDLVLSDPSWNGFVSGGFIADSKIDGTLFNISQQQWLTRDSHISSNSNGVWNQVFSGVIGAPAENFPPSAANPNPYTVLPKTPESKEKPYMYIDENGIYNIFVPSVRHNSLGTTWDGKKESGTAISLDQFYIAKPTDTAAMINHALSSGLNLIFTPGIYNIDQTINITRNDTVVYGMGMATLRAVNGVIPMKTADVSGVSISGLMFEAGSESSPTLLQIGDTQGTATNDTPNTTHDVFFRIGGAQLGKVKDAFVVNSAYTLMDNSWVWRADHGDQVGWTVNTGDTGVVVNGDYVQATGFFVEHFQKYQVIWNGEHGKTIMFQNEIPYDVPNQTSWMHDGIKGYAAYKVSDTVKNHEGWGLGSYSFFSDNHDVKLAHSFEVPRVPNVNLHHLLSVSLQNFGEIEHIANDLGESTTINIQPGATSKYLAEYPIFSKGIQVDTVDAKNPTMCIAGVTYEIKDINGKIIDTVVSTNVGLVTTKDLRYGTYTVTQKSVPKPYKIDATIQTIVIDENTPTGVVVPFKLLLSDGTLTVYALDGLTQDKGQSLSGAVFEVYDENNKLIDTKETHSSAIFTLAPGKYTLKEKTAPQGYQLTTKVYSVVVEPNKDVEVVANHAKIVEPVKPTGTLTVYALDGLTQDKKQSLSGAVFEVHDENNKLIDTKETHSSAIFTLAPGKYTLKEKTAPQGYQLSTKVYSVVVEPNKDVEVVADHAKTVEPVKPIEPLKPTQPEKQNTEKSVLLDNKVVIGERLPDTGSKFKILSFVYATAGVSSVLLLLRRIFIKIRSYK